VKKERDVFQYISSTLNQIVDRTVKKYPERKWMFEVQRLYWQSVYEAYEKGVPFILHSSSFPPELIYAFGAVPLCLDSVAVRLASLKIGVGDYIDIAQRYVPDHICALNKTGIGLALSGDMYKPDALIYAATPCDSARIAYPLIAEHLGVRHFCIDTPYEQNERGYEYIGNEMREVASFLEGVIGHKLDWNQLVKVIEYSNQAYELISQIAELRKTVPCPLPGRLLVLNEIFGIMAGSQEIVDFLRTEYDIGKEKVQKKEGYLAEEKFRVAWIQNPIWFDVGILDWMEKEYGAIVTMDAFGFQKSFPIENTSNETEVFKGLGKRLLRQPMIHGSSGPTEFWMDLVTGIITEYKCNAAIFAGHVGCKHTWAVGKLIKDMISDQFGIPTLVFDVDALDPRYRGSESIKTRIKNFMEMIQ
jgi:benzoyl-CoA reductase/2-hydroxyglutaryl-CoA dehydratase subunit BcrC/BadD/HgdB